MKTIEIIPLSEHKISAISIPGSKSYTNRALILAALTLNSVRIKNPLFSDDTKAMISCLQALGIKINVSEEEIEVVGSIDDVEDKEFDLNADLSGTTIRFVLALATIVPGIKIIHGETGLNKRPIKDLVAGLRQLGAKIEYVEKEGFPPLRVASSKLLPGTITMNGKVSSQFLSALLLIAPIVGGINVVVMDEQISKPYIDMTIDAIKKFGVEVISEDYKKFIISKKQKYEASEFIVEGDFSSAGYFLAIAALTKSTITLNNLNPDSLQADKKLLDVLEKMGNKIIYGKNQITIGGRGIKPMEIDVTDFPDQAQTLAVLAAFTKGTTKITGIASLRVKETERVVALQKELEKMGIKTTATNDTLTIQGGNPKPATIDTYGDHRMAMAFAVAGAKLKGIKINDPEVVGKTFPNFFEKLEEIGVQTIATDKKNVVLIGMRGSGKTTIAKLLSKKLNKNFIDLDKELTEKIGLSVAKIVEKYGWDFFREKEAEIVKENSDVINAVIATGGGVILRQKNVDELKKNGMVILLNAPLAILLKRVGNDRERAPLTDKKSKKEEMREILKQREVLYKQTADVIIDTGSLNKEQTVNKILVALKGKSI